LHKPEALSDRVCELSSCTVAVVADLRGRFSEVLAKQRSEQQAKKKREEGGSSSSSSSSNGSSGNSAAEDSSSSRSSSSSSRRSGGKGDQTSSSSSSSPANRGGVSRGGRPMPQPSTEALLQLQGVVSVNV